MANKFLIFIEHRNGEIKKSSLEVLSKSSTLASQVNAEIEGVIIGNTIDNLSAIGKYGVTKLVHLKNENLGTYSLSAYSDLLVKHAKEIAADVILLSNTAMGIELAPIVAIKLNAGIITDCIALEPSDNKLIATRPVYAGKAFTVLESVNETTVYTLRPNVFSVDNTAETNVEIVVKEITDVNLSNKVISATKTEGKLDVAEADIIVSGGRGLKAAENFKMIEDLAKLLGAATGASRAVVDAGWRPHNEQVGQTGKTVSPNLYIAVGISGAIQHLAGMQSSKFIVAINKDKDAPIFSVADYGIIGDAFEIVPSLIEELKK